ncbi:MAG: bifunctional 4-hydroxy-2-oxoglutarate aldolase/2-dehydro-3-deoxy-phosphogluconate aldolase [Rhizobiales bacterium]|nr:bifunctional 4-hydroxy-2-oxoglutarate aldolase/2-dehydro-3-deoxy-phosphogluconate aldolase [Hyphomicrobiales bacterium]
MINGAQSSKRLRAILKPVPIVPVLVVNDPDHAVPLAEALVAGGLPVVEVTLRTACAIEVIQRMSSVKDCVVGVGTLLTASDVVKAKESGAQFGVSPGSTDALVTSCETNDLPLLAGVSSASEIMRLCERGYDVAKFFPAETSGGVGALAAFSGPLPQFHFCPTGGLNTENVKNYLTLPNVLCVGGSWIVPSKHLANKNWPAIEKLAAVGSQLS